MIIKLAHGSIHELMNFARQSGERVDELVSRFETLHHLALTQGGSTMSTPGAAGLVPPVPGQPGEVHQPPVLHVLLGRLPMMQAGPRQNQ